MLTTTPKDYRWRHGVRLRPSRSASRSRLRSAGTRTFDWLVPAVGVLVLCMAGAGCAKKRSRAETYSAQVSGRVTLDGIPLPSGTVTLLPERSEEDGGRPGIARIEPDGSYRVGNANPEKPSGMLPGRYVVTVLRMELEPGTSPGDPPVVRQVLPGRYLDARTTPFACELVPGANRVDLELVSEGAAEPAAMQAAGSGSGVRTR